MAYNLGAVLPHVRDAAELLGAKFNVRTILGWGVRPNFSYHALGRALDLMTSSKAQGDAIAAYSRQYARALGIIEVIWYQKIWTTARASEGWRPMSDRGSATANHYDHVHLSFAATRGSGNVPDAPEAKPDTTTPSTPNVAPNAKPVLVPDLGISELLDIVKAFSKIALWGQNPHNWLRIAMGLAGAVFIIVALIRWDTVKDAAAAVGKAANNATA